MGRARPFTEHLDIDISRASMCQSVEIPVSKVLPFKAYDLSCSPNTSKHTPPHPRGFLILKRWTLRTEGIEVNALPYFLSLPVFSSHKKAKASGLALWLGFEARHALVSQAHGNNSLPKGLHG